MPPSDLLPHPFPVLLNMSQSRKHPTRGTNRPLRRVAASVVLLSAILALFIKAPSILAWRARLSARSEMEAGALTAALQWLDWADSFQPDSGKTTLLQASCFRQLDDQRRWLESLQLAERQSAPKAELEQERMLGMLRWEAPDDDAETAAQQLLSAGASPNAAMSSLVTALLSHGHPGRAARALEAWSANFPADADVDVMSGLFWQWKGDDAQAENCFRSALSRQPRHETARVALAGLCERQERLSEALGLYMDGTRLCPGSSRLIVGAARMLRCTGRNGDARALLTSLAASDPLPAGLAAEMGQVEFEDGDFEEAARWFERADLAGAHFTETLRAAASTFAFVGNVERAEALFSRIDVARNRSLRLIDLQTRQAVAPGDQAAAGELQRLSATANPRDLDPRSLQPPLPQNEPVQNAEAMGLYQTHCSACHGARGDGRGRAARHLFPRPRDLRRDPMRLVSAVNGAPTPEDLLAVIQRGMPGTSMRAFDELSDAERKLLAQQVVRFMADGIREQVVELAHAEDEEIDADEIAELVKAGVTPTSAAAIPAFSPPDAAAISRGAEAYASLGCAKCHGDDGSGPSSEPLFDNRGLPTSARNLVHDEMRGGSDPAAIYLRIRLGMPGTPHPSCLSVPEEELIGLVHYCRSLAEDPPQEQTGFEQFLSAGGYRLSP